MELTSYFQNVKATKAQQVAMAFAALNLKGEQLNRIYSQVNGTSFNISKLIYDNKPLKYNLNMVDMLEQLAVMANRTFPY